VRFSRKRQDGFTPNIFFQGLGKTFVHYNLRWKAMHSGFKEMNNM